MLVVIFFLYIFETFVKNFKVFLTFICRLTSRLFWILFTIANDAFFLNDCETKLFPSFTFPLIAKNTSFFFTSLELILALFIEIDFDNFWVLESSFIIFIFNWSDKFIFFLLISLRIFILSENLIFFLPISCIFSWPFPATTKTSPLFKF